MLLSRAFQLRQGWQQVIVFGAAACVGRVGLAVQVQHGAWQQFENTPMHVLSTLKQGSEGRKHLHSCDAVRVCT
jgi:hypothetical protein